MEKPITVQCYAGYRADERPTAFQVDGKSFHVEEIVDRWYDVNFNFFKVRADDGGSYLLRHNLNLDCWELHLPDQNG